MSAAISRLLRGQLARNAMCLYAVQGLNFLLPLVLLPYLLRVLSPTSYGSIVFAQSIMGYAIMFTDFGFNLTAARDISVARNDPQKVARVYWTTMAAKGCLLLVSMLGVCGVVGCVPRLRRDWDVFAMCTPLLVGAVVFPGWYFQGLERLREVAIVQAASKCITTAGIFGLVRSPHDKLIAALIMSSPQLIGMSMALVLRLPTAPSIFYRPRAQDIRTAIVGSANMFFASASTSLYVYTNAVVLGFMAGERQVAFYSLGNRLILAIQGLSSPVTQAVFPRASLLFASTVSEGWRLVKRVSWLLLPSMALAWLGMLLLAPFIVKAFGGPSYLEAASVVRIMAPIPLVVTAASLLSQTVMVNIGLSHYLWRIYTAVGVANLLILPLLVYVWAANGAALSLTMAESTGPLLMLWVLWRKGALPEWRPSLSR